MGKRDGDTMDGRNDIFKNSKEPRCNLSPLAALIFLCDIITVNNSYILAPLSKPHLKM